MVPKFFSVGDIKQPSEDQWTNAKLRYPIGSILDGRVVGVADSGVVVELAPGIESLVHASKKAITRANLIAGAKVEVRVCEVDEDKRRIGLRFTWRPRL